MDIKIENYIIRTSQESGFDLLATYEADKTEKDEKGNKVPTGETYIREKAIGYNMTIERAIERIIHLNLCKDDSTVTLEQFLEAYKAEKGRITSIFNEVQTASL